MNPGLTDILLESQKDLIVPLKQVEKEEALEKNSEIANNGYRVINKIDDKGYQITKYVTVDFDKYETYRDDNELIIRIKNMKNLKTIKNCAIFFTILIAIGIVVESINILTILLD